MSADPALVFALLSMPGVGAVSVKHALAAAQAVGRPPGDLMGAPVMELLGSFPAAYSDAAEIFANCSPNVLKQGEDLVQRVEENGSRCVPLGAPEYPSGLSASLGDAAPPILCVRGNTGPLQQSAAGVVGARRASQFGLRLAVECARLFAKDSIPVVSGGAEGVDAHAHYAAAEAAGFTVIVLPQGILTYTEPPWVEKAIELDRAVVLSEFLPNSPWSTHSAVTRNKTISALSRLVCVIEPKREGGSIRTAKAALQQGKHVLVHCAPDHGMACKGLIQGGAVPILDENNTFSPERIWDQWNAPPRQPGPVQQDDLF